MGPSSKIGIGVGIAIAITALVIFTNIDDLISETVSDTISEIKVTNPLLTYEINTKEEFSCALQNVGPDSVFAKLLQGSPELFEKKYPNVVREITEYTNSGQFQRDFEFTPSGKMPYRFNEIILPVMMNELSINPTLEDWILDMLSGELSDSEMRELDRIECAQQIDMEPNESMQGSAPGAPPGAGVLNDDHAHTSILVRIFGDKFDFSSPAFQIKSTWIHFEGQDGDTVHRHSTGVTLGYLFETLGITVNDECFVFPDGRQFCNNDDYSIKFFINHQQVPDIAGYVIDEDDKILISYGNETPEQIKEQLQELDNQLIFG